MESTARQPRTTRFGPFEVDPSAGRLRKNGIPVRLQDQPLKLLLLLLDRPGQVVTREEMRCDLWPTDSFGDFDNGLNVAVRKLRAALDDDADRPRYIETVPRRGYRSLRRSKSRRLQSRLSRPMPFPLCHSRQLPKPIPASSPYSDCRTPRRGLPRSLRS